MRASTLVSLLGAALLGFDAGVLAADCVGVALSVIPSCAQSCFLNGAPSVGCGGTDFACQCQKEAALYAAIEGCVATGCPSASHQAVIDGASSVCNCAGGGSGGATMVSGSLVSAGSSIPASMPATMSSSTMTSASSTASAGGGASGGGNGGNPIPTPTIPSMVTPTGASSAAVRQLSFGSTSIAASFAAILAAVATAW